jgi:glucose/arabinose dehydrogenase
MGRKIDVRRLLLTAIALALAAVGLTACGPPPTLSVSTVVGGLDHPWDVGFAPTGQMFVTERPGRISVWSKGTLRLIGAPSDVIALGEGGMMGLAVDPKFSSNRFIYTCETSSKGANGGDIRVVRWTVNSTFTALSNRTDIVPGIPFNTAIGRHSGCRPRFGPDGLLYIGTGDTATGTVPQNVKSLGGKILRVDRNGHGVKGNPGIDNPASGWNPRVYNIGHRNVQGIAWDPVTHKGFSVEHGTDRDDELNTINRAANYGWDPVPGYDESTPMTDLTKFPNAKVAVWSSGFPTIAPSGATFLRGAQWKGWDGAIAVAVLKGQQLRVFQVDSHNRLVHQWTAVTNEGRLRSAVLGINGLLYITTDNGNGQDKVLRVIPS